MRRGEEGEQAMIEEQMIKEKKGLLVATEEKLSALLPYFRILCRSKELGEERGQRRSGGDFCAGLEAEQEVQQRGFSELFEIENGGAPKCCVCLDGCDYSKRPTFMRCAHFGCEDCILHWLTWRETREGRAGSSLSFLTAPCPLCRKTFSFSNLIKIVPPASEESGVKEKKQKGKKKNRRTEPLQVISWSPAAESGEVAASPPPPQGHLDRSSIPGIANFPSLDCSFGSYLHLFCKAPLGARSSFHSAPSSRSSRVERLLIDLKQSMKEKEKVVVFSQYHSAIAHVSLVLQEEGIKFVRLTTGEEPGMAEDAVRTFNEDPQTFVFLLNAGQLAAGLTLSIASHVILLEPFTNPSEEAQAMNRCHRIGQSKEVCCTVYYSPWSAPSPLSAPS